MHGERKCQSCSKVSLSSNMLNVLCEKDGRPRYWPGGWPPGGPGPKRIEFLGGGPRGGGPFGRDDGGCGPVRAMLQ